jgi:hypothetical protein
MIDQSGIEKAIFIFKPTNYGVVGDVIGNVLNAGGWLTAAQDGIASMFANAAKFTVGGWSPAKTIQNAIDAAIDSFAGIPFVLDERTFKIVINYPTKKSLAVYEERPSGDDVWRYAKTLQNDSTITIHCKQDNIFMTSLSMFIDTLIKQLSVMNQDKSGADMTVNFFYKNVALKNVIISGYETRPAGDTTDDVLHIITISDNIKADAAAAAKGVNRPAASAVNVPKEVI